MADSPNSVTTNAGGNHDSSPVPPWRERGWLAAAIALVSLSCFHFPTTTFRNGIDPSWMIVLHYARQKGWHMGRDIISLYGPWGFLAQEWFYPHAAVIRIFFEIAVGCAIATGLCLVAWRMKVIWRIVALGYFVLVAAPCHPGGDALFIDLGLFCWGLLCLLETGPRLPVFACVLATLAAAGALVKNTTLITGLFTIALIAFSSFLRGRRILGAGMLAGFMAAYLLGWLSLGEPISGLGPLFLTSSQLTRGYNEANGVSLINPTLVLLMGLAAAVAVLIRGPLASIPGRKKPPAQRIVLTIWLAGMVFEGWKYGSVRTDEIHLALACGFLPIAAICAEAIPVESPRAALWSRAGALFSIVVALMIISAYMSLVPVNAGRLRSRLGENLMVLTQPVRYLREKTEKYHLSAQRYQLPKIQSLAGNSTVDVFGGSQILAIFNDLNYRPRPNFQNIIAYSRPTMEINDRFLCSSNAPEFMMFNLEPIDLRFPPLEDAWVLRDLLENYDLAGNEGQNLLLRRNSIAPTALSLIKEGSVGPGEKINIADLRQTNLWMEIDLQPTLWGRLRKFLYKTPSSEVTMWSQVNREPAKPKTFHAPASMLSAGFLISPLILNNNDVIDLYSAGKIRALEALSVETSDGWKDQIHFRLYRIENKLGPHRP
jgi:hypothetical protein